MKFRLVYISLVFLAFTVIAQASNWYADSVNGNDSNSCLTPLAACRTIGHAISLASQGDSIVLAPTTFSESITIPISLSIVGSNALKTVISGQGSSTVTIPEKYPLSVVTISGVTITGGHSDSDGGGISNWGDLSVNDCVVAGNTAEFFGAGISTHGGSRGPASLVINKSTIGNNRAPEGGGIQCSRPSSPLRIYNSAIWLNKATAGNGGGLLNGTGGSNFCSVEITNSTISGNTAIGDGGGVFGPADYNNVTVTGNSASGSGGGVFAVVGLWPMFLQNSILADNSSGNCNLTISGISQGYNLSSDNTCNLTGIGDLNGTDPLLGSSMQNNGGPTRTTALLPGSPAIDSGNPSGCADGHGHLLTTDQRGYKRPGDPKLTTGCDRGAYEVQF